MNSRLAVPDKSAVVAHRLYQIEADGADSALLAECDVLAARLIDYPHHSVDVELAAGHHRSKWQVRQHLTILHRHSCRFVDACWRLVGSS
jgi:hypothetical protein